MGADEVQRLVVFSVGAGDQFAMPIERVQEVVRYVPPRAVASPSRWLSGVTSLRGVVLPVCDLATRLGVPSESTPTRLVVCTPAEAATQFAFSVAEVAEIATVAERDIERPQEWHDDAVTGIARIGERIVVVLDPDQLTRQTTHEHDSHDGGTPLPREAST